MSKQKNQNKPVIDFNTKSILDALSLLGPSHGEAMNREALAPVVSSLYRINQALSITLFFEQIKATLEKNGISEVKLNSYQESDDEGGVSTYFNFSDCKFTPAQIQAQKAEFPNDFEYIDFSEDVCDNLSMDIQFNLVDKRNLSYFLDSHPHLNSKTIDKLYKKMLQSSHVEILEYLKVKGSQNLLDSSIPKSVKTPKALKI